MKSDFIFNPSLKKSLETFPEQGEIDLCKFVTNLMTAVFKVSGGLLE